MYKCVVRYARTQSTPLTPLQRFQRNPLEIKWFEKHVLIAAMEQCPPGAAHLTSAYLHRLTQIAHGLTLSDCSRVVRSIPRDTPPGVLSSRIQRLVEAGPIDSESIEDWALLLQYRKRSGYPISDTVLANMAEVVSTNSTRLLEAPTAVASLLDVVLDPVFMSTVEGIATAEKLAMIDPALFTDNAAAISVIRRISEPHHPMPQLCNLRDSLLSEVISSRLTTLSTGQIVEVLDVVSTFPSPDSQSVERLITALAGSKPAEWDCDTQIQFLYAIGRLGHRSESVRDILMSLVVHFQLSQFDSSTFVKCLHALHAASAAVNNGEVNEDWNVFVAKLLMLPDDVDAFIKPMINAASPADKALLRDMPEFQHLVDP